MGAKTGTSTQGGDTHHAPELPPEGSENACGSTHNPLKKPANQSPGASNIPQTAAPPIRRCPSADSPPKQPDRSCGYTGHSPCFPCGAARAVAQYAGARRRRAMQPGRLAQRERRCLTSTRSQVQILYRPPENSRSAAYFGGCPFAINGK